MLKLKVYDPHWVGFYDRTKSIPLDIKALEKMNSALNQRTALIDAMQSALRAISSGQIHDKDVKGTLERALFDAGVEPHYPLQEKQPRKPYVYHNPGDHRLVDEGWWCFVPAMPDSDVGPFATEEEVLLLSQQLRKAHRT